MSFRESVRNWWQQHAQPLPSEAQLRAEATVHLVHNPPYAYEQLVYDDKFHMLVAGLGDIATDRTQDNNQ